MCCLRSQSELGKPHLSFQSRAERTLVKPTQACIQLTHQQLESLIMSDRELSTPGVEIWAICAGSQNPQPASDFLLVSLNSV